MSLFKKKESGFDDMDSQGQLKRIMEQLGFLEKKMDTVLEELRNRGGSRPSFGGHSQGGPRQFSRDRQDRGGFRGNNNRPRPEGGSNGGNTRYAGQGPRRYTPGRPFGNEDNRGNYGGNNRPEGVRNNSRPNNNRRPQTNRNSNSQPAEAPQSAAPEAQPE